MYKLLSFLILITLSNFATSQEYYFYLDCTHLAIDNEWSKDRIYIRAYDEDNKLMSESSVHISEDRIKVKFEKMNSAQNAFDNLGKVGEVIFGFKDDSYAGVYVGSEKPKKIILSTTGTDAVFIDRAFLTKSIEGSNRWEMMLTKTAGSMVKQWGANGLKGWCLSKDPDDGNGSWSNLINGCFTSLVFNVNTGNVRKVP